MEIQITMMTQRFIPSRGKWRNRCAWWRITTSSRPPVRTISTFGTWEGNSAG